MGKIGSGFTLEPQSKTPGIIWSFKDLCFLGFIVYIVEGGKLIYHAGGSA